MTIRHFVANYITKELGGLRVMNRKIREAFFKSKWNEKERKNNVKSNTQTNSVVNDTRKRDTGRGRQSEKGVFT